MKLALKCTHYQLFSQMLFLVQVSGKPWGTYLSEVEKKKEAASPCNSITNVSYHQGNCFRSLVGFLCLHAEHYGKKG